MPTVPTPLSVDTTNETISLTGNTYVSIFPRPHIRLLSRPKERLSAFLP